MNPTADAYLHDLEQWLSRADWHTMLTLTNSSNFPPEWFFARLEKLVRLFRDRFGYQMEYAASIEKTKRDRNHCHALVRWNVTDPHVMNELRFKCGSAVFPSDWRQRQKATTEKGRTGMATFIYNFCCGSSPDWIPLHRIPEADALKRVRDAKVSAFDYLRFWYQGNYGVIADCQPIRKQASVVKYALKYALKEVSGSDQNIRWMVSIGAVPTLEARQRHVASALPAPR